MSSRRSFNAVVLRLRPDTAERLRMAAARHDLELEAVAENLIEQTYGRDGLAAKAEQTPKPDSTLDASPSDRREIDRLVDVAREVR